MIEPVLCHMLLDLQKFDIMLKLLKSHVNTTKYNQNYYDKALK